MVNSNPYNDLEFSTIVVEIVLLALLTYTVLKLLDAMLFFLFPTPSNEPLLLPLLLTVEALFAGAPVSDATPGIEFATMAIEGGFPPHDNMTAIVPPMITAAIIIKGA
jgi:hypothetical protein